MDFIDQIKQFSKRVESLKDSIATEEATKTAIIMPFFSLLGYDVFNPSEFVPEFTADVGIKKGEKVDYAIVLDGQPTILVEAKWIGASLEKHDSQLFRYFGTTKAKFGILTNGILYRFFTDLDEPNKMDGSPFFEFNLFDIKETHVVELKKFCKSTFNLEQIVDAASDLKFSNAFKGIFSEQLVSPSDEFVRFFLTDIYPGMKTQNVLDRFRAVLKKSLNNYISELMNDKLKAALDSNSETAAADSVVAQPEVETAPLNKVETTEEELGAFYIIRNLLNDATPAENLTCKDTVSYFNVLYKGNTRKWICRLVFSPSQKILIIPDVDKNEMKYPLEDIYAIAKYKENLLEVLNRYL